MRTKFIFLLIVLSFALPVLANTNLYQVQVEVCPISGCTTLFGQSPSPLGKLNPIVPTVTEDVVPSVSPTKSDVFEFLPYASTTEAAIEKLTLDSFSFIQLGEALTPAGQNIIRVNGRKPLTIALTYDKVPAVLKTIGVTIFDPIDEDKGLSFVLRGDDQKRVYTATIAPLDRGGIYPVAIHVINYHDQQLKKINGYFQVSGAGFTGDDNLTAVFNNVIKPIVITSGILAGASQIIAFGSVASLYDVYLLILRGIGAFFSSLGIKRKNKPWGTVYDSVTKRPIDPAYVTVYQNGKELQSAITDIEGRYGFFLPPGTYELSAQKTHYQFPSRLLEGKTEDELYGNLYFGGFITTQEGEAVAVNIPMDPVSFDWNEFAKSGDAVFKKSLEREVARARFYRVLSVFGLVLALGSVIFSPSFLNLTVLLVYVGLSLFSRSRITTSKLVTIKRQITGEPIPFAIVRIFLAGVNKEIKTLVADRYGRVYLLVRPGKYYVSVDKKLPDGSYFTFYKSEVRDLANGLWPKDIIIPQYRQED
jgi:hypothetical protein